MGKTKFQMRVVGGFHRADGLVVKLTSDAEEMAGLEQAKLRWNFRNIANTFDELVLIKANLLGLDDLEFQIQIQRDNEWHDIGRPFAIREKVLVGAV